MLNRLADETVEMNPSIRSAVQNNESINKTNPMSTVATELVAAAASKTDHSQSNTKAEDSDADTDTPPPKVDHYPELTDRQLYERILAKKQKAHGRKGDPRMNQALLVCLDDPDLPHLDALLLCGFDFSPLSREELEIKSSRVVTDVENTTLKQRLDQLGRRLRTATKWIKVEREEGGLLQRSDDGRGSSSPSEASSKYLPSNGGNNSADPSPSPQKRRRDSFDEAIEELPGMEGLGDVLIEDGDDMMLSDED